ncbi:MAG: class I SAM-dependent methyltransferase [Thaumarchaeota archaeon]|nr:class I SAM-dependent methyltransferase [Nitrososphaerota archaeon]
MAPRPGERILDVGAGWGTLADLVRSEGKCEVYAVDTDKKRIARMQEAYPALKSSQANSEDLPFPDSHFDKVYSTMALHHFSDQRRAVKEFARILKPMGLLLIVEIQPSSAQGRYLRFFENGIMRSHLKFLEMNQLAEMLKEQGRFETKTLTNSSFSYFIQSNRTN